MNKNLFFIKLSIHFVFILNIIWTPISCLAYSYNESNPAYILVDKYLNNEIPATELKLRLTQLHQENKFDSTTLSYLKAFSEQHKFKYPDLSEFIQSTVSENTMLTNATNDNKIMRELTNTADLPKKQKWYQNKYILYPVFAIALLSVGYLYENYEFNF